MTCTLLQLPVGSSQVMTAGSSEKLTPCRHADIYFSSVRPRELVACFFFVFPLELLRLTVAIYFNGLRLLRLYYFFYSSSLVIFTQLNISLIKECVLSVDQSFTRPNGTCMVASLVSYHIWKGRTFLYGCSALLLLQNPPDRTRIVAEVCQF